MGRCQLYAMRWIDRLGSLLLPAHCLLCRAASESPLDLCAACIRCLPRQPVACPRCALPLPVAAVCGGCLRQPPRQQLAWSAFSYAAPLDQMLARLKYGGELAVARSLGQQLAREPCPLVPGAFDLMIPAPLHPRRLRQRGFNQALELCRPLARQLRVALEPDGLRRERDTAPQAGLAAAGRQRNLRHAFVAPQPLSGASVLLFDDVITTGATMQAMARTAIAAGARRITVACLARTPTPGGYKRSSSKPANTAIPKR